MLAGIRRRVKPIDNATDGTGRRIGWRSRRVSIGRRRSISRLSPAVPASWKRPRARQSADRRSHANARCHFRRSPSISSRAVESACARCSPLGCAQLSATAGHGRSRSPRPSSSSIPRRCCTTMSSTRAICAAAARPPTRLGQPAGDPRRRFPVQRSFQLMVGTVAAHARDPVARRHGHRRRRGAAADDAKRQCRRQKRPISR